MAQGASRTWGCCPKGGVNDAGCVHNIEGINDTGCQRYGGVNPLGVSMGQRGSTTQGGVNDREGVNDKECGRHRRCQ